MAKRRKKTLKQKAAQLRSSGVGELDLMARIKKAGILLPTGATSRYPQTGTTTRARDIARKAKPPGWRISEGGKLYFENRRNRSDRNLKKRI